LVANSELTEHAACKFIGSHPTRFDRRYTRPNKTQPGDWSRTLHRQFLKAKAKAQKEFAFKLIFLGKGPGLLRAVPEYGPELFEIAIERYGVARKGDKPCDAPAVGKGNDEFSASRVEGIFPVVVPRARLPSAGIIPMLNTSICRAMTSVLQRPFANVRRRALNKSDTS
jgi:hypothetical protein